MSFIQPTQRLRWFTTMILFLTSAAVAGCGRADMPATASNQVAQVEEKVAPTVDLLSATKQVSQFDEKPTPTLDSLAATKQAIDNRIAQELATAEAQPTPSTPIPWPPTGIPIPPYIGIEVDCDSLEADQYDANNCWRGPYKTLWFFIVAGAQPTNTNQGMIWLFTADPDTDISLDSFSYAAPSATGALTITQVALPLVTVVARDGQVYVFNIDTRTWSTVDATATGTALPMPAPTNTLTSGIGKT